jgi:RNA polymerase sigma factor (sigma-70 family)
MPTTPTLTRRNVRQVSGGDTRDNALIARIMAGDDSALSAVYDLYSALVYGLARRVTRDEQLARDITQDVFTYFWQHPGRVDLARGSLRSYLAVLAHRRAVDEVRRSERQARAQAATSVHSDEGPETGVVESLTNAWRSQRLSAALAELPTDQRKAVELAYYDGLTYKQVATVLRVPEGTAKSRLRLAMNRLRLLLGDEVRTVIS